MLAWEYSKSWQFYAGYARFSPGRFPVESSHRGRLSTPFFMVNYTFE